MIEIRNNGPEAARLRALAAASVRRSVYLPLVRGVVPTSLEVFDPAEQGMVTGARDATTVAPQALYQLNDPFVRKQALAFADRLLDRSDPDDDRRVDLAYRLALGRSASREEVARAKGYVAAIEADAGPIAPEARADRGAEPVAVAVADEGAGPAKVPPPINPDQVIPVEVLVVEEVVRAPSTRAAAWASFCQALLGSAEFRYVSVKPRLHRRAGRERSTSSKEPVCRSTPSESPTSRRS